MTVRKKATYDKFGEEGLKGGIPAEFIQTGAWSSAYVYHGNPEKTFRQFFGSDNPFAGRKEINHHVNVLHADFINIFLFLDFYTNELPLQFGGLQPGVIKNQDPHIERDLHLSLDDLFHGCSKKIKISRRVRAYAH